MMEEKKAEEKNVAALGIINPPDPYPSKVCVSDLPYAIYTKPKVTSYLWVACSALLINPLFGAIALTLSLLSSKNAKAGNYRSARRQAKASLVLSVIGFVVTVLCIVLFVSVYLPLRSNYESSLKKSIDMYEFDYDVQYTPRYYPKSVGSAIMNSLLAYWSGKSNADQAQPTSNNANDPMAEPNSSVDNQPKSVADLPLRNTDNNSINDPNNDDEDNAGSADYDINPFTSLYESLIDQNSNDDITNDITTSEYELIGIIVEA